MQDRILVIRFGALGDMVTCFQSFHEIRRAHPHAKIALLTAPAFVSFANRMPWFDCVFPDPHPSSREPLKWLGLARMIYNFNPGRVYELHGKLRQSILFMLLGGPLFGPEWSGAAPLCSHPRLWPPAPGSHFREFLAAQLRRAGVEGQPPVDLTWLDAPIDSLALPSRYAVLIPGCTPGQIYKRWPATNYAALARWIEKLGYTVIAIGTKGDVDAIKTIQDEVPSVVNLSGRTDLFQLAGVLRHASFVVGNDTGPMHMAAALGAPTWALISERTNPVWSAPQGRDAHWLQRPALNDLPVDEVIHALEGHLGIHP